MPIISNFPGGSGSGGGGGIALADVSNIQTVTASGKVYLKWTDPEDTVVGEAALAAWAGTILVRKAGSAPMNRRDGVIVLDSRTRNAYADAYFCDSGLSDGITYYYKFFPYTTTKVYTDSDSNMVTATPEAVMPDNVTGIAGALAGNGKVSVTWSDPANKITDGITVMEWAGTKVVYKKDSYPTGPEDGTLALNSTTRDQHKTAGLTVSGLDNGETYYFAFFPYSTDGAVNVSEANRITVVPNRFTIPDVPSQNNALAYTGGSQSPTWSGYDEAKMTLGGVTAGIDADTYTATFTPEYDYCWSDGSVEARDVTWTIERAVIAIPSQSGGLTYTGAELTPAWSNYDENKMAIGGKTVGTDAGSYAAEFTPGSNYRWPDKTTAAKSVNWTIGRATLTVPSQSGTLTYTGTEQSPAWNNYDSGKMTLGETSGTNAGSYNATFTPHENYQWPDGTITAKTVTWNINKAACSMSVSPASLSLTADARSKTITVTRDGDGQITATSSNTGVATVSVSGTTVTVNGVASGSATITISAAAGTNHNAPANKTVSVTAELVPAKTALNSMSWSDISKVAEAGLASSYWSVGDTKTITINGKAGNFTFSNLSIDVFIIGFNHNPDREGNNRIHFQIGKISGKMVALCDSQYGNEQTSSGYFHMNTSRTNSGGWNNSAMRKTLLGNNNTPASPLANSLMAALPSDLRAVMKGVTKYSDNTGGGSNTASYVTATTDYLFIPAEYEVFGTRYYANSTEQNYQKQYTYYSSGNSRVSYKHSATGTAVWWWLRSAGCGGSGIFCYVSTDGSSNYDGASWSAGVVPCFVI